VEKVELRRETENWVEEMKTCGCPHILFVSGTSISVPLVTKGLRFFYAE
jgi:hypothetical protein